VQELIRKLLEPQYAALAVLLVALPLVVLADLQEITEEVIQGLRKPG
jgi:hypothetical protein